MISETAFATHYASLWRTLTPLMDHFVRRMNLDGYERDFVPLKSSGEAERRGILNDAANRLFGRAVANANVGKKTSPQDVKACILEASLYVQGKDSDVDLVSVSETDIKEVVELSKRIRQWFVGEVKAIGDVGVSPAFLGHGIMSACHGDFVIPAGIVEIKAGDRMFRSADYRQVTVYVALNFAETSKIFERMMLVNPRVGVSVSVETEAFAREVAGQSAAELCSSLLDKFGIALVSP